MKSEGQRESLKHEKRIAKEHGGKRVKASGATWLHKGDVSFPDIHFEHKWTGDKQLTIKSVWLKKAHREAVMESKTAVLGFHLDGVNYVVLREDDYWAERDGRSE